VVSNLNGAFETSSEMLRVAIDRAAGDEGLAECMLVGQASSMPEDFWPCLALAELRARRGLKTQAAEAIDLALARGASFETCRAIELLANPGEDPLPAEVRGQAHKAAADLLLRRELVVDEPRADVLCAPGPPGADLVVVFTGLKDRVSVALPTIDRFFAARGWSAMYCRDFSRQLYLGGIRSLGSDIESTADAIAEHACRMQAGRLFVIGNSAGGYAAIRYGARLAADGIAVFGAPTNASTSFLQSIGDERAGLLARRLERSPHRDWLDLRSVLIDSGSVSPIDLYYGAGMPQDRSHARHLAGLPGVALHEDRDCASHAILSWMIADRRFDSALDRLGSDGAQSRWRTKT
jgi:hypothetical protein